MIELRNVSFAYEGQAPCIHDINLTIGDNECVVVMGCSGNGKTTLTRLINGLIPSHYSGLLEGEIFLHGKPVLDLPQWERARRIGNVFQDPRSHFFSSELAGEIAFAGENFGMPREEIRRRTNTLIEEMGLSLLQERAVDLLSNGETQKVAIASVRVFSPEIYIFDEPSANLDDEATEQIAHCMKALKALGHTLIIVEHRLHYLADIADRFLYMEKGRLKKEYRKKELLALSEKARTEMGIRSPQKVGDPDLRAPESSGKASPSLTLDNISCRIKKNTILKDFSLTAYPGQIIAVTGKNGVGKTSLATILCGLRKESSGELIMFGKKVSKRKRRQHVWYSANDTNTQFFTESVTSEILLGIERNPENLEQARKLLKEFSLHEYKERHPLTLSGGEKQRLSIACGIVSNRKIIILDEPTSGLDGRNMRLVSELLKSIAAKGKTIFLVTHDPELMHMCCNHHVRL
jgi:energy-coupling factor transport system ATP-binding protein